MIHHVRSSGIQHRAMERKLKRLGEKIGIAILGLVAALVALELSLRAVSHFFWRPTARPGALQGRDLPPEATRCRNCLRVLCVGDSFTYGFGADEDNTYPAHLQRILNDRRTRTYVVVNGGRSAASTTAVLDTLKTHLEALPIDLVVAMAGNSNVLNFSGYLLHLYRTPRLSAVGDFLFNLRTVRYGWYVAAALRARAGKARTALWPGFDPRLSLEQVLRWQREAGRTGCVPSDPGELGSAGGSAAWEAFEEGVSHLFDGDVGGAVARFKRGVDLEPGCGVNYYGMGIANRLVGRVDDAIGWFQAGIREAANDPTLYAGLGEALMEKAGPWYPIVPADLGMDPFARAPIRQTWSNPKPATVEAIRVLRKGISVDETYSGAHCALGTLYGLLYNHEQALEELKRGIELDSEDARCYPALVEVGRLIGRRDELVAFLEPLAPSSRTAARYLRLMRSERDDYAAWIRSDLRRMVSLCRQHDVPLVFLEYPSNVTVNAIMNDVAREERVPIVRDQAHFQSLLESGTPFEALFVPDGHCNDRGYGVLAEQLYEGLEAQGVLAEVEQRSVR